MKKLFFFLLVLPVFVSCGTMSKTITVTNHSAADRTNEMLEIKLSDLQISPQKSSFIIKADNEEIPYQILNKSNSKEPILIFQANVKAGQSKIFKISNGKPAATQALTYARHISERKDDFAWENDLAAYRMYGPALANENPSNGVDLWLKRTSELVINKRYHDELKNGKSYHNDHGDGLDCYKVGHTLGAGGIAPYAEDKLWVGNYYNHFKVLENGPLRTKFKLKYDNVKVGEVSYTQTITITLDAGSIMNKAVVKYEGASKTMKLAGGIFLHDGNGSIKTNNAANYIAYAESAVSDAGVPSGRNYVGVIIPNKETESQKDKAHILLMADYTVGTEFIYYFGGGWSKWGYPTDADWFKAVEKYSNQLKVPLEVKIK